MLERLLLLSGGVEMTLGAAMQLWPDTFPPGYAMPLFGIGVVTCLVALWMMRDDLLSLGSLRARLNYLMNPYALMTLRELRAFAAVKGWKLDGSHNDEIMDLQSALNEAGPNGFLDFHARENTDNTSLIYTRPRRLVTKLEWQNLQVGNVGFSQDGDVDNEITRLEKRIPLGELVFSDVHVRRNQAARWLRRHAEEHKGKTAKRIAEREARRS